MKKFLGGAFVFLLAQFLFLVPISSVEASWNVWTESILVDKIKPDYNPTNKPTSISLKGGKGEWLSFYVVMRGNENINNFVPTITSTLTNGTQTIANSNWTEYMVQLVDVGVVVTGSDGNFYRCILNHTSSATNAPVTGASWSTYWVRDTSVTSADSSWATNKSYYATTYIGGTAGKWPDPVVPYKDRYYGETRNGTEMGWGKTVNANNTHAFIYEIYIPSDAVAGNYTGTVTLSGQGAGALSQSIAINLEVWDFNLPQQWSYGSTYGVTSRADYGTLFGTRQKGYDMLTKFLTDHGMWPYIIDSYVAPAYVPTTGGVNFNDASFNDSTYGFKRWYDGKVANSNFSPRPYYGFRPKASEIRTDSGAIFGLAALYTDTTTVFSDNGAGGTRVKVYNSVHNFQNGDTVQIWGSAKYDGVYTITNSSGKIFDIAKAFSGDDHSDWYTRAINITKFRKYFNDWDNWIAANSYSGHTYFNGKIIDEAPYPECCSLVSALADAAMTGGTSSRSNIWLGQTLGAHAGCGHFTGQCEALRDKSYHLGSINSEMMGFIRPGGTTLRLPGYARENFSARETTRGDKVWIYTANTQNMDYNVYSQTDASILPSWYIDTKKGARENASGPLSMWIWDVEGYHFWALDGGTNGVNLVDIAWDRPTAGDPGNKINGDAHIIYSGFASSAFNHDIGGTNNILVESLRMKLYRWGMNVVEYAKLLEAQGKTDLANAQIANMVKLSQSGDVWGTVEAFESARIAMGEELSGGSDTQPPAAPKGLVVL